MNSSQMDLGESVIFQPVLKAYPTRHSWIITAHISLGNLECHWKLFNRQLTRTQQFLRSLDQHPSTPTQLLSTLQLELSDIQDIYSSGESTISSAIKLLQSNQPQTHIHHRGISLQPFLGDALSWLTGTATTKDIHIIKTWINQLIATHTSQHNTLVHIVTILNITRYATQVNRQSINTLMDKVWTTSHDINNLYNLTTSLATSINFNQMMLHIRLVFANYLHTHIVIKNKQFLLLIDVPIQDRSHQITIHQILILDIPHGTYSAHYDVNTKYFGVTKTQQWQWNSPLHNFRHVNKPVDSSAVFSHLFSC